jgi:hypothetical protein
VDVRISPAPSDSERAVIVAALGGRRDGAPDDQPKAWLEAALAEGVEPADSHGSEPTL